MSLKFVEPHKAIKKTDAIISSYDGSAMKGARSKKILKGPLGICFELLENSDGECK